MTRIIIQIEDEVLAELDDVAKEEKASRSAFVREAIVMALAERRRRRELDEIIKAYKEHPQQADELLLPKEAIRKAWPS